MKIILNAIGSLLILVPTSAVAQNSSAEKTQEIVISATRIETPLSYVASSTTVITSDDLERKQKKTVIEALKEVPRTRCCSKWRRRGQHLRFS